MNTMSSPQQGSRSNGKPFQKSRGNTVGIAAKFAIIDHGVGMDAQQAGICVMVWCLYSFRHLVYEHFLELNNATLRTRST